MADVVQLAWLQAGFPVGTEAASNNPAVDDLNMPGTLGNADSLDDLDAILEFGLAN